MITLEWRGQPCIEGANPDDLAARFPTYDLVRQAERASIRDFMEAHREYLRGRVLDFGAGTQPYRDLVQGEYVPYEKGDPDPSGEFDAVMCNQVMQYLDRPCVYLDYFRGLLRHDGCVVLTYPTNWDEVECDDLHRFTKVGMERLLAAAGFTVLVHERRAQIVVEGFVKFPLGYGCIARK